MPGRWVSVGTRMVLAGLVFLLGMVFAQDPPMLETTIVPLGRFVLDGAVFSVEGEEQRWTGPLTPGAFFSASTFKAVQVREEKQGVCFRREFEVSPSRRGGFDDEIIVRAALLEGGKGRGIILFRSAYPAAPGSGESLRIFGLREGRLVPFGPWLTVEGSLPVFNKGKTENSFRLDEGDAMVFYAWCLYYGVRLPMRVDWKAGVIEPLRKEGAFPVEGYFFVSGRVEGGEVYLFPRPDPSSSPARIRLNEHSEINILESHGGVSLAGERDWLAVYFEGMLRIKVDGQEGFVRHEDLWRLGLGQAG